MPARRSSRTPWFVGGAAVFVVGLGALALARSRNDSAAAPSAAPSDSTSIEAVMAAASATLPAADPAERTGVMAKSSLDDAIAAAKPKMTNTNSRLDEGSALLALWASKNLTWNGLQSLVETTPSLFRKDPDAERGKRLCVTGVISEIRAEKTLATRLVEDKALPLIREQHTSATGATYADPGSAVSPEATGLPAGLDTTSAGPDPWVVPDNGKVFIATISTKPPDSPEAKGHTTTYHPLVVEIIAVKSTGTLVDGGEIRACGVLTGVTMPAGSNGADSMEHRIVGLFDLPENR